MTESDWITSTDLASLEMRANIMREIRRFFDDRNVMELETPVIASHAVTDVHIDSMRLASGHYLNSSPEYCMKRFLAEHRRDVYQVCKCFRDGEAGQVHNPEFSMLEWYRIGFSLEQLMDELARLVESLSVIAEVARYRVRTLSFADAFQQSFGIDPHVSDVAALADVATRHGIEHPQGLSSSNSDVLQSELDRDAWLDWLMSIAISPSFAADELTFIVDYPVTQAALAQTEDKGKYTVARRFELYIGALELANGYQELTDAPELRARFERDQAKRALLAKDAIDMDESLLAAMQHGLPECSGVAVGLDRLCAVLLGRSGIDAVTSYTWTKV